MRRLKTTKVEVDLETVLRTAATMLVLGFIAWLGVSLLIGRAASPLQAVGGELLVLAVYLMMPAKSDE